MGKIREGFNYLKKWAKVNYLNILVISMIIALTLVYFSGRMVITVYPGEEGVLFRRFNGGTEMGTRYKEGIHVISPWNIMYIYDVRVHEMHDSLYALTSNGLMIKVQYSVLYKP